MAKILIACEYSGTEREAFRTHGHNATSCDLLPADDNSTHHYQGDVRDLMAEPWDMVIAHPPCTYLANSGARWLKGNPERWELMGDGANFFALMFQFNTPRLCVENPIQHKHAKAAHGMGHQTQTVQPWMFGHTESKATCYWLRGLPILKPTDWVHAQTLALPAKERNRIHYASPGADRWKLRSASYPGIAKAMADQWGPLLDN